MLEHTKDIDFEGEPRGDEGASSSNHSDDQDEVNTPSPSSNEEAPPVDDPFEKIDERPIADDTGTDSPVDSQDSIPETAAEIDGEGLSEEEEHRNTDYIENGFVPPPKSKESASTNTYGDVGTQFNIADFKDGKIDINIKSGEGGRKFSDPTKVISNVADKPFDLSVIPESKGAISRLKSERVLMISLANMSKLEEIAAAILEEKVFLTLEKRGLYFLHEHKNDQPETRKGQRSTSDEKEYEIKFDDLIYQKIGRGRDSVVVVYLTDQNFLDSMKIGKSGEIPKSYIESITHTLQKKETYIIILNNETELINHAKEGQAALPFFNWELSPIGLVLSEFLGKETARLFEKKIIAQSKHGIWGEGNEAQENVKSILQKGGLQALDSKIQQAEKLIKDGIYSLEALFREEGGATPKQIIENEQKIIKHICFIATYFPELSVGEFSGIVEAFLEKKQQKAIEKSKTKTINTRQKKKKKKKSKTKEVEKKEEVESCQELWRKDTDDLIARAHLRAKRNSNGKKTIDFDEPYLRESFYQFFEERNAVYHSNSFHFLLTQNHIIFNTEAPDAIVEGFIKLFAKIAANEPDYYGKQRLLELTLKVSDQKVGIEKTEDFIEGLLATLKLENFKHEAFRRIGKLVLEMLNYTGLKPAVDGYFNTLLNNTPFLVLRIISYLRFSDSFDKFYWYKQVFDRADKGNKENACRALLSLFLNSSPFKVYEFLHAIKEWHPESNKEHLSDSNAYSIVFLVDYALATANDLSPAEYGAHPSTYPLFAALTENEEENKRKIQMLLLWLKHPSMEMLIRRYSMVVKNREEASYDFIFSLIIERWYQILMSAQTPSAFAAQTANVILRELAASSDKKEQRNLIKNWNNIKNWLFDLMRKISNGDFKQYKTFKEKKLAKEQVRRRRDIVKEMIAEFKSLN